MTRFLQQVHTHSNKAIPSKSATAYEIIGSNYIQTTTAPLREQCLTLSLSIFLLHSCFFFPFPKEMIIDSAFEVREKKS